MKQLVRVLAVIAVLFLAAGVYYFVRSG